MQQFLSATVTSARAQYGKATAGSVTVEDESLIRMNAVHMVEDAGYAAQEAANAPDAIEILKQGRDIALYPLTSACPAQP